MGVFGWTNTGARRPPFAIEPGPGEESVWDYPRPPVVVPDTRPVIVGDPADPLAASAATVRVLETASPPTFYLPPESVNDQRLVEAPGSSHCEWKGAATYWALAEAPDTPIGWTYRSPRPAFADLAGWYAFYPSRIECRVDGVTVAAQAGGFYGGWVTPEIIGPYKGEPGTSGW